MKFILEIINKNPCGALTSKSYAFGPRPWELKTYEVFDPVSEFYVPSLISVVNNEIQRILPINNSFDDSKQAAYNWIPNRLRFLFENISSNNAKALYPLFPDNFLYKCFGNIFRWKFVYMPVSWNFLINSISSKISNFKSFSRSIFSVFAYQNFDIYSMFFLHQLLQTKVDTFKFFREHSLSKSLDRLNAFWPLIRNLSNPNILKEYSTLILIGVNVYFLNPNLHYQMKKKVCDSELNVYTFLSSNFGVNFKHKNAVFNLDNVKMLFSGRHKWSKLGLIKNSSVIIDYDVLITWPNDLKFLIFQFWKKYPQNISLINNKNKPALSSFENFGASSFLSSKDIIAGDACFSWMNFFFLSHGKFDIMKNNFNILNYTKLFFDIPDGLDYKYIFDYNKINFILGDPFKLNSLLSGNGSNYFIPTSEFGKFTSLYRVEVPRNLNKIIVNNSQSKPLGQYFFILNKVLSRSKNYTHISKYIKIYSFFQFISWFFFNLVIGGLFKDSALVLHSYFNNFYIIKPTVSALYRKIFFTLYKANLYKFFYFKMFFSCENTSKQKVPIYYFNWYANLNLGLFSSNSQIQSSRTLLLDKNFFYYKFINFKK